MEVRGIPSQPDRLRATVTGEIGPVEGTLKITRIHVLYEIVVPKGMRAETERALAHHASKCPVAQTLTPCVQIEWEAEITETEEEID
ncbi:MAG: OsmC family protein [Gemmatimonadales bacterium]